MNYKNFQIKQATNDLIEKFIKYRELAFIETEDIKFVTDDVSAKELFKQHRINSRHGILLVNEQDEIVGGNVCYFSYR